MAKKTRRLARQDICIPRDTHETPVDLTKRLAKAKQTQDPEGNQRLSRDSIRVAEKVFQWRISGRDVAVRDEHILGMAKGVLDRNEPLDRIVVFPVGDYYYVVDGHHRLAAYDTAGWTKQIPATVFGGTLESARLYALTENSKDKLRMSRTDKSEAAWRLVCETNLSINNLSKATDISKRTISYMRKELANFKAKGDEIPARWTTVLRNLNEEDETRNVDDWIEQRAQKLVDALLKANIGQGLMKNPDITARALRILNDDLPRALMMEWQGEEWELIEEMAEERKREIKF